MKCLNKYRPLDVVVYGRLVSINFRNNMNMTRTNNKREPLLQICDFRISVQILLTIAEVKYIQKLVLKGPLYIEIYTFLIYRCCKFMP